MTIKLFNLAYKYKVLLLPTIVHIFLLQSVIIKIFVKLKQFKTISIHKIVAGTTNLALSITRILVSHVLIPKFNKIESTTTGSSNNSEPMDLAIKLLRTFDTAASLFHTLWLLIGSYFVYSCYNKVTHTKVQEISENIDDNFCVYSAYTFAFIIVTINLISLILSLIAALGMFIVRNTNA